MSSQYTIGQAWRRAPQVAAHLKQLTLFGEDAKQVVAALSRLAMDNAATVGEPPADEIPEPWPSVDVLEVPDTSPSRACLGFEMNLETVDEMPSGTPKAHNGRTGSGHGNVRFTCADRLWGQHQIPPERKGRQAFSVPIVAIEVLSQDPVALANKWGSALKARPFRASGVLTLRLRGTSLSFAKADKGALERITTIEVAVRDPDYAAWSLRDRER